MRGSERTTRRAVAGLKAAWHAGRRRVHRPWVPEPGMWAQYDFGDGPRIGGGGDGPVLPVAGLVPVPGGAPAAGQDLADGVAGAVDVALRRVGGVPTYLLTDNEKTVTVEHVAGIPVRNPAAVELGRHYGLTVATCVPYDPASKGGSESTVKVAKADLVPTEANLLAEYGSFAALEAACQEFCDQVNARPHRITRRAPAEMLAEERARLHPVPEAPFTAALGVTRTVDALSLVTFEGGQYSVPHQLAGQVVWVRRHGEQVVITHAGPAGVAEVARHLVTTPGSPRVEDSALPARPARRAGPQAEGPDQRRGAVPGDRRRRRAVAGRGRRRGRHPGAGQDGPGGPAGRPARRRRGRPGARAGRRRGPVRRPATWPRSWPTRPPPPAASRPGPASSTRWPRAPAGGRGTAGGRRPDDTAPRA